MVPELAGEGRVPSELKTQDCQNGSTFQGAPRGSMQLLPPGTENQGKSRLSEGSHASLPTLSPHPHPSTL